MYNWSHRKKDRKIFEGTIGEKLPNLTKTIRYTSKQLNASQVEET